MIEGRRVAVVLPAYNAERTLRQTCADIPAGLVDDLILTDDCSTDGTIAVAKELGLHVIVHDSNKGYGANQKSCYSAALERGADIVVMLHPDYQYSPRLVTAMAAMIASGHYDAIFASRILGRGAIDGGMPRYKYVFNRLLTLFQNIVMGQKLSEYHTGYRAWHRSVLEKLPLRACSDDFVFDNQMIAQAAWFGFNLGEISCPTKYFAEASSINCRRSCIYGLGVLRTSIEYRLCRWGLKRSALFEPAAESRLPVAVPVREAASVIAARLEQRSAA